MIAQCRTCRFWRLWPPDDPSRHSETPIGWGQCSGAGMLGSGGAQPAGVPPDPIEVDDLINGMVVTHWEAELLTASTFGCNSWTAK